MALDYHELFLGESREHIDASQLLVDRWEDGPPAHPLLAELMRHSHSLKGMAAAMGYDSMVALAHAMEDLFEHLGRGGEASPAEAPALVGEALSCLERIVARIAAGEDHSDAAVDDLAHRLRVLSGAPLSTAPSASTRPSEGPALGPPSTRFDVRLELEDGSRQGSASRIPIHVLRELGLSQRVLHVRPPKLDPELGPAVTRLELVITHDGPPPQLEAELRELPHVRRVTVSPQATQPRAGESGDVEPEWLRVRADQFDGIVEHALELLADHGRTRALALGGPPRLVRALERQEFLLRRLYALLVELRLVPFDQVTHLLQRAVRRVCRDLRKPAKLEILNGQLRVDRRLLDQIADSLQHLVHNAIDHGLESQPERVRAGKPATGGLRLTINRRAHSLELAFEDDGRGLSPAELAAAALRHGFVEPERIEQLSEEETLMLITLPGFTTANRVTPLSGRGVGMDVVRESVERLGGRLTIRSTPGRGTRITLEIPLSMALVPTLIVRCGGELFGVPIQALRRTDHLQRLRTPGSESRKHPSDPRRLELIRLDERLGLPGDPVRGTSKGTVLEIESPEAATGLVVDEILGRREMIVRPMRPPLSGLEPYTGVGLMENGSVVLVVDPSALTANG